MVIPVKTTNSEYNIYLERGALSKAGEYLNLARKVLIVTDDGVPSKYSEAIEKMCKEPYIVTLPQGEKTKNIQSYTYLLSQLVKYGFSRTDCVVAVGGGVMGDLAGFAASTFMRGIDFYNVPTTVLSQVDSSIGGKVAIDFEGYKNIVGAFYPPRAVIIDPDTLETLDKRQISNGLAESVKMSLTCDAELFETFEKGITDKDLDKVIYKSLLIKKSVVEQDEKETGLRKILNFGHTIAHAIESETNLKNLYHGECVAIGMLAMCSKPVRDRLLPVLEALSLPISADCDKQKLRRAIMHDKKVSGDKLTVVYVQKVGSFEMKTIDLKDFEV